MPPTSRRRDLVPSPALVLGTLREHRVGIIAWVLGGAVAMLFMGLSLDKEMREFPGGAQAIAASVMPAVEAMRPLRWPAEHLETLGGYLTFHNIVLVQGFLAIYGAMQGAGIIRRFEERHALEQVLATGWSRGAVIRDRVLGFVVAVALIAIGLATGVALTMSLTGNPDVAGSFISLGAVGLCGLVAFGLGLLMSQVIRGVRAAAGVSVLILVVLYLTTNTWEQIGWLGVIRFISPFYYANLSRALVPGYGFDALGMLALVAMSVGLVLLAALAFAHRDYGATLWARQRAGSEGTRVVQVQHWWLRSPWLADAVQHRIGILGWTAGAVGFVALMMALQPTVIDAWTKFDFMMAIMGGGASDAAEVLYTSFVAEIVAPVVVAYVIAQAAGWVTDLEQGRVESLLSAPISWGRLVVERMLAAGVGVLVIVGGVIVTIVVGSVLVGSSVDAAGLARVLAMALLLGWATAAMASIAVAAFRRSAAVTVLAAYVTAAYLLTWLIPIFHWPEWVSRTSIFVAFGHPYQAWPAWAGIVVLVVLATVGTGLAVTIAERSPKVAP